MRRTVTNSAKDAREWPRVLAARAASAVAVCHGVPRYTDRQSTIPEKWKGANTEVPPLFPSFSAPREMGRSPGFKDEANMIEIGISVSGRIQWK